MALSGFNGKADDNDNNDGTLSPPIQDLKIMTVAGVELVEETDLAATLVNDQELHVVFRISDDEYEPVQIEYADDVAD